MSTSSGLASSFPAGYSLTGGLATKNPDLAASIVFIVAFALLVPLALWRWVRKDSRSTVLIRPSVVIALRLATYVVRAIEANGSYSKTLFTVEQVFLLIGLVPLVEPVVSLLKVHFRRGWTPTPPAQHGEQQKEVNLLSRLLKLLQVLLLVDVILGIIAGTKSGDATTNPSAAASLKTYRYAVIGITLGILVTSTLINLFMHFHEDLPLRGTLYLLVSAGILIIPNVYKLVFSLHPPSMTSHGTKAGFYLLSALPEWIVTTIYFSVNLNDLFDIRESKWKDKVEKKMKKGQWPAGMGYAGEEEFKRIHSSPSTTVASFSSPAHNKV